MLVKGYDRESIVGEDVTLGERFKFHRYEHCKPGIEIGKKVYVDPRRGIEILERGGTFYDQLRFISYDEGFCHCNKSNFSGDSLLELDSVIRKIANGEDLSNSIDSVYLLEYFINKHLINVGNPNTFRAFYVFWNIICFPQSKCKVVINGNKIELKLKGKTNQMLINARRRTQELWQN